MPMVDRDGVNEIASVLSVKCQCECECGCEVVSEGREDGESGGGGGTYVVCVHVLGSSTHTSVVYWVSRGRRHCVRTNQTTGRRRTTRGGKRGLQTRQTTRRVGKQESRKDGVGRRARKRKHTASTEEQTEQDQSDRNESRQRRRRKVSWHVPCTRQKADMEHVRRTSAPGSCLGTGARCPDSGRAAIR